MMAALADMIPGAAAWPRFTRNKSEQFEARLSLVEVLPSPSIFFSGMAGSRLPIAVAHGEGFADFSQRGDAAKVQAVMRFVDHAGRPTEAYPANPNGSVGGLTAVTTADGRYTALMPHAERVFRRVQLSWSPGDERRGQRLGRDVQERAPRARIRTRADPSARQKRETSVAVKRKTIGELRSQRWFSAPEPRRPAQASPHQAGGLSRSRTSRTSRSSRSSATWSDFNTCHAHFPQRIEEIKRGIWQAGGFPAVIPVQSVSESFLRPTSMLYRNLLAMEAEEAIRAPSGRRRGAARRLRQDRRPAW